LCVASTVPVRKVRALLLAHALEAVPVVDQELRVVGVVTRGDLLTAAPKARSKSSRPRSCTRSRSIRRSAMPSR
jgi:CBS-domain-containing membrane protein